MSKQVREGIEMLIGYKVVDDKRFLLFTALITVLAILGTGILMHYGVRGFFKLVLVVLGRDI